MHPSAILWARAAPVNGPAERAALMILASYAQDGITAWPSLKTLARDIGAHSISYVREILKRLKAQGHIHTEPGRGKTSTRYRLTIPLRVAVDNSNQSASREAPSVPTEKHSECLQGGTKEVIEEKKKTPRGSLRSRAFGAELRRIKDLLGENAHARTRLHGIPRQVDPRGEPQSTLQTAEPVPPERQDPPGDRGRHMDEPTIHRAHDRLSDGLRTNGSNGTPRNRTGEEANQTPWCQLAQNLSSRVLCNVPKKDLGGPENGPPRRPETLEAEGPEEGLARALVSRWATLGAEKATPTGPRR